jgi:hypothetical protein
MSEMHGCLIAPKKATATKMIFTKRATTTSVLGISEKGKATVDFLSSHINMITLERKSKELLNFIPL